jgi:DNA primase
MAAKAEVVSNRWFYGEHCLHEARGKALLVTEGIPDAVAALQANIPCLSPATVTFREADWPRLSRLVKPAQRIVIINDNEENQSGERGAVKTAAYLFQQGIDARIGTLPRSEEQAKIDMSLTSAKMTVSTRIVSMRSKPKSTARHHMYRSPPTSSP